MDPAGHPQVAARAHDSGQGESGEKDAQETGAPQGRVSTVNDREGGGEKERAERCPDPPGEIAEGRTAKSHLLLGRAECESDEDRPGKPDGLERAESSRRHQAAFRETSDPHQAGAPERDHGGGGQPAAEQESSAPFESPVPVGTEQRTRPVGAPTESRVEGHDQSGQQDRGGQCQERCERAVGVTLQKPRESASGQLARRDPARDVGEEEHENDEPEATGHEEKSFQNLGAGHPSSRDPRPGRGIPFPIDPSWRIDFLFRPGHPELASGCSRVNQALEKLFDRPAARGSGVFGPVVDSDHSCPESIGFCRGLPATLAPRSPGPVPAVTNTGTGSFRW